MARTPLHKNAPEMDAVAHVAAYLRVSTDEQAQSGLGLADQRQRVNGMAAAKGWPAPTVYADEGISGTKDAKARPSLARLLADVRAGQVDAVIVLDLSRLGRKTRLVLDLVDELTRYGVALVSCKESLDTTSPQGQFVLTLFAALAQLERDLIAERTQAALNVLGRTTGDRGGRVPYGYRRTERGLTVNRIQAAIVRRIFAWHRRGLSLRDIAYRLREQNVAGPRGDAWHHSSVAEILKNRAAYLGGYRAASQVRWPAILGKYASDGSDTEQEMPA